MTVEERPSFLAWLSWRDGKTALRNNSLLAMILLIAVNELFPLRTLLPHSTVLARVLSRLLEFLVLCTAFMVATWLIRRGRISRDRAREEASA